MKKLGITLTAVTSLALAGCTPADMPSPSVTPTTPATTASVSAAPASPSPSESEAAPTAAPSPDPSTAGSLDAGSLPQEFLGFVPDVRAPEEGEFVPNGTWVFAARDAAAAAEQTWPRCGTAVPTPPVHVLMGLYADGAGAPGVGQAFEFVDADTARQWFEAYATDIALCATLGGTAFTHVVEHTTVDATVADRRLMDGQPWGERVWLDSTMVRFMAVQADPTLEDLLAAP